METNNLLTVIEKLKDNSHLGKHKHFFAADRKKWFDLFFGLSIMIINLCIAVIHLFFLGREMDYFVVYFISGISIFAVFLAGMELRYNFAKAFEAHRRIGNKYLVIARESEKYIADFKDGQISKNELSTSIIPELNKKYNEINVDAESFPTRKKDYRRALKIQKEKLGNNI